ncbi:MAG: hypothetical protein JEZ03_00235 [Bacteroidales bacterium]|nr:hypothetical protein [Bacteroidales bacterium]
MKLRFKIGLVLLFVNLMAWSQSVDVTIDTNEILIGDQVKMKLMFKGNQSDQVLWPVIEDTLSKQIEVVSKSKIDTLIQGDILQLEQLLTLTSFDSGYHVIPSLQFDFKKIDDTIIQSIDSDARLLTVHAVEIDTTQAIMDIKPPLYAPIALAEIIPWVAGIAGGGLLIALIVFLFLKFKRKEVTEVLKFVPEIPPHLWAIEELEKVKLEKLWQSGKIKEYYTRITDVTRKYIELRYHIDALEMTSDEVLLSLKDKVHPDCFSKLNESMFLSDMVKFAKAQPQSLEHDLCYNHLVDFVNETKQSVQKKEQLTN